MRKELRFTADKELRTLGSDDEMKIGGYAAVFEKYSQPIGRFIEKIAKGAFASSLAQDDIRALWSHNSDIVLGRTRNQTLRLFEDDFGLGFELMLPATQAGRDAYTSIKRGDVSGVSFGFSVLSDSWKKGEEGKPHERTLNTIKLFEISPTAFPAYEQTSVAVRAADDAVLEVEKQWARELEAALETAEQDEKQRAFHAMRMKLRRAELGLKANV